MSSIGWHPANFESALRIIESGSPLILNGLRTIIRVEGYLSCPPPSRDPTGTYRIIDRQGEFIFQRRSSDGRWEAVDPNSLISLDRTKAQKFDILDSPTLLESDLTEAKGVMGTALVYLDIDDFKKLNTRFSETTVDLTVLPEFQKLITDFVAGHGFAYAEGGDEVILLFPNTGHRAGVAFCEDLRELIRTRSFDVDDEVVGITISIGVTHDAGGKVEDLQQRANEAKNHSKKHGKNCTSIFEESSARCVLLPKDAASTQS